MAKGIRDQDKIEQRVNDLTDRLARDFDLGWMTFKNSFDSAIDGDRIVCQTFCDWEYRQATFKWNTHQLSSMQDDELELTAIHEMVHCLNAVLWESLPPKRQNNMTKLNELSVENITRVIAHLYRKDGNARS